MGKYYAVRNGHNTGVYNDWSSAKAQVNGYSGNEYKSFNSAAEANAYMSGNSGGSSGGSYSGTSQSSYGGSYGESYGGSYGGSSSSRQIQEVYTDGSCFDNGRSGARAGWGAHWGDSRDSYGSIPNGTNNSGELYAIKDTMEKINDNPGGKDYKIYSDSQYSVDAVNKWGNTWDRNGYKTSTGGDVKNAELIQDVRGLMNEARSNGVNVSLEKVKGHANIPGNVAADRLAKRGARQ